MHTHRATADKDADLHLQVADLRMELDQAKEEMRQAQWRSSSNIGNLTSNADAWATPRFSSVPTQCPPSNVNPSVPDALCAPVGGSNLGSSVTGSRPTSMAISSYPKLDPFPHMGLHHAQPSGLDGSPIIRSIDRRPYGYGTVGQDSIRDDRSNFGRVPTGFRPMGIQMAPFPAGVWTVRQTESLPPDSSNVWPTCNPMPPNSPVQTHNEVQKQMHEASSNQSRGQHGLSCGNQGFNRRGEVHNSCEHHERGN